MSASVGHGITLDPTSFRAIADLAYRESGLTLVEEKSSMIQSRLRHRLRDLGLPSFEAYCALVTSEAGAGERRHLISALTTNVSHFFRESHHFDTLKEMLNQKLPYLRQGGEMRVWSAGSSNGQEALSMAMTALEHVPDIEKLDFRILGTDIDPEVVSFARAAVYPERLMGGVPPALRQSYFQMATGSDGEACYQAKANVRRLITFNELNLLADWPMRRHFDVIFCRNVVIYFDQETQMKLWPRYHKALTSRGVLLLGHSERIADPPAFGFECTGPTTYHRLN
ncbi:MAG: protein-glutamate O-methyltransferase [Pseudomonadota bacterium]